ncbi:MAG: rhodanese-like domain-containing protein [Lachnospiraceae bacterium]|nr:rhodanese-like domain-containing protein [Lachnospiraceae bacterium]
MRRNIIFVCLLLLLLTACGKNVNSGVAEMTTAQTVQEATYMQITPQEAKEIMDTEEGYVILDVRSQSEYDEKHIPGAILIPDTEIEAKAEDILTEKDQLILVYCRSGRRSKNAASSLAKMGYTNVKEFGGINDWPYEVEK